MTLSFKRFQKEYYPEYTSWFSDPELNNELGPMDEDWLNAILSEKEEDGVTWAVFLNEEMVGVIETVFDPENKSPAGITAIAVKPTRRRQGLAKAILARILADHHRKGIRDHIAYIKKTNVASLKLVEGMGFVASSEPDKNGFIEYRHCS